MAARPVAGQAGDPKTEFLEALGRFSLALDGTYGDEGPRLLSDLDSMASALSRWEAAIANYERAMAAEIGSADRQFAARMHLALGGVYLDRGRVADALTEFTSARTSDPTRPDPAALQGLVHAQITRDTSAALEALRSALALDPKNPFRTYLLARYLLKSGKREEAIELLQRSLADRGSRPPPGSAVNAMPFIALGLVQERVGVEPFLPPLLYAEGFAALQRGELTQAIARLREAVRRDPLASSGPGAGSVEGPAALFRDGLVGDARKQLEAVLSQQPAHAEAHRILGLLFIADGENARGIDSLRTAARLNPTDERAQLALADALIRSQQFDAADRALQDALKTFPTSARAHYLLGLTYQRQARPFDAVREFEAALSAGPLLGANTIQRMIGVLHQEQQELDAAADAFAARLERIPNDSAAHRELGQVYIFLGEDVLAQAELDMALLLAPSDVEAYVALGQLHLREGRLAEAAEASRRALEVAPSDREARYVHATALIRLGNTEAGTREMEEFQRLQARDSGLRAQAFELGRLRREAQVATSSGNHGNAVTLLRQALRLEPTASVSHLDLGLALVRAGQFVEAIERLNTAAALNAHFDVHRHLAEAFAALGRTEDSQREQAVYENLKRDAIRKTGRSR